MYTPYPAPGASRNSKGSQKAKPSGLPSSGGGVGYVPLTLLTDDQIAEALGIDISTLMQMHKQGRGPTMRRINGHLRATAYDVETWRYNNHRDWGRAA
jgi:hypothetical protein